MSSEQKHTSTISELVQVEEQLETYKLTLRDAEGALEECVKDREAEKERERALQEEAQEWKLKCMAAADEVESLQRSSRGEAVRKRAAVEEDSDVTRALGY